MERLADLARNLQESLAARGVSFTRTTTAEAALSLVHPSGWQTGWKEDHFSATHGSPTVGWLTVYPVVLREKVSAPELLDAFLEEFIAPGATQLSQLERRSDAPVEGVEWCHFEAELGGALQQGLILATEDAGRGLIAAYWVSAPLFRPGPVENLVTVALGSIETLPGSRFAPRRAHIPPLRENEVWQQTSMDLPRPFASPDHRVALRLPADWDAHLLQDGDDSGLLIYPTDRPPGTPGAPVIVFSSADLLDSLENTLREALQRLADPTVFHPEYPPQPVEIREEPGLVQLLLGEPPDAPGTAVRLWSLGLTDGSSIVHLCAICQAAELGELLPALCAIGRSLKVLPRTPDYPLMARLTGTWRFLEETDDDGLADEVSIALREDGSFAMSRQKVRARDAVSQSSALDLLEQLPAQGTWDVVDRLLSLFHADEKREVFAVDDIGEHSAILGQVFWKRC